MKTLTYQKIQPYIEKKLISEQIHPEDPNVRIFNYTQKAQFEKAWDEVTMNCRGLIMNIKTGEILARPFPKFFNYGEHTAKELPIPNEIPIVTDKLDGSLGIMYTLNGKTWIATRGAFLSEQAVWATEWWRKNKGDEPYGNATTHLFEIIYPANRIVVNYDFQGLVHIASIDTKTGLQVDAMMPVRTVKKIPFNNLEDLAKIDLPNSEGFVIYYPSANLRLKIKFPEYVRLHKLVTGVSEIAIWEHLREGNALDDLLDKVPDEFFNWVKSVQKRLTGEFTQIYGRAGIAMLEAMRLGTRKEQALLIMKDYKDISGIVFSVLDAKTPKDEKKFKDDIWRKIRPHGNSQFKTDLDL